MCNRFLAVRCGKREPSYFQRSICTEMDEDGRDGLPGNLALCSLRDVESESCSISSVAPASNWRKTASLTVWRCFANEILRRWLTFDL